MPLLFVYGSLKQGFDNEHVNTGRRLAGRFRTRERFAMYLLGSGEVPCIVTTPGEGFQVAGEVYEVDAGDIKRMDVLERIGEPHGYDRVELAYLLGADGKRSLVNIGIPDSMQEDEVVQYFDDIFHEAATPKRPAVLRLA